MSDLQSDTPSMYTSHGVSYYVCHDRIIPFTSNVRFLMLSKFECQISIFAVSTSYFLGELPTQHDACGSGPNPLGYDGSNLGYIQTIQYTPKFACPFLERGWLQEG